MTLLTFYLHFLSSQTIKKDYEERCDEHCVTSQTQKGSKREGRTIKSENVGVFFFSFDKINKYIDLSTIQVKTLSHIYKQ